MVIMVWRLGWWDGRDWIELMRVYMFRTRHLKQAKFRDCCTNHPPKLSYEARYEQDQRFYSTDRLKRARLFSEGADTRTNARQGPSNQVPT